MRWPKNDLNKILLDAEKSPTTVNTGSRSHARRLYWALYGRNRSLQADVIIHTPTGNEVKLSPRESVKSEPTLNVTPDLLPNS